jgi:predicted HTH transcriptional regulator
MNGSGMMIQSFLVKDEGKTLEFKENCRSLRRIVQSVVAFANTSGGAIVIGIRDKTKEIVGLADPLKDEERLANAFADAIVPCSSRISRFIPGGNESSLLSQFHI